MAISTAWRSSAHSAILSSFSCCARRASRAARAILARTLRSDAAASDTAEAAEVADRLVAAVEQADRI